MFHQATRLALKIASSSCCVGFYDDSRHVIIHVAFHNCAVRFDWSTPWLLTRGIFSIFMCPFFLYKTHREKEGVEETERGTDMEGEERGIWLEKQEECSSHSDTLCHHPGELTQPSLSCTGGTHTRARHRARMLELSHKLTSSFALCVSLLLFFPLLPRPSLSLSLPFCFSFHISMSHTRADT